MAALSDNELARYARQLILPEVDLDGQAKLKRSRVLIVGAGGLQTPWQKIPSMLVVAFIAVE